jgi:hypothetical protein
MKKPEIAKYYLGILNKDCFFSQIISLKPTYTL